jgi:hypothetical protein
MVRCTGVFLLSLRSSEPKRKHNTNKNNNKKKSRFAGWDMTTYRRPQRKIACVGRCLQVTFKNNRGS